MVIGDGVEIGDDVEIGDNVTLHNCSIGSSVVIHPGVRVGQDGFGFQLDARGQHAKKPQELRVEIHDHVDIGCGVSEYKDMQCFRAKARDVVFATVPTAQLTAVAGGTLSSDVAASLIIW